MHALVNAPKGPWTWLLYERAWSVLVGAALPVVQARLQAGTLLPPDPMGAMGPGCRADEVAFRDTELTARYAAFRGVDAGPKGSAALRRAVALRATCVGYEAVLSGACLATQLLLDRPDGACAVDASSAELFVLSVLDLVGGAGWGAVPDAAADIRLAAEEHLAGVIDALHTHEANVLAGVRSRVLARFEGSGAAAVLRGRAWWASRDGGGGGDGL